jgi:hypothetical protein
VRDVFVLEEPPGENGCVTDHANSEDDVPEFSKEMAWKIYRKTILVGLTYLDSMGNVIERRQMRGEVIRVNPSEGIVLRLDDDTEYALPPDFRPIREAKPGEYRLRSTGDVVLDPDYTATYTIKRTLKQ